MPSSKASLPLHISLGPRGDHVDQHLPVAADRGARVLRVGGRLLWREGEEDGAPPLPGVEVALARRPPPAGVEAAEEAAQGDAEVAPLAEAVLPAERDALCVSQDERRVGAVQISLGCAGMRPHGYQVRYPM